MPTAAFYTLGCKVNQQETDSMRSLFMDAGYEIVPFDEAADVYIINTCTLTSMSDKKSRNIIARANAKNPEAVIAVMGCYSQRAPEEIEKLPGVKLVAGTQHRDKIVEWVESAQNLNVVEDINNTREFEQLPGAKSMRTRVQLKVQDGCDRYCAYCIVPYARGPARSLPIVMAENAIARIGAADELVLTGIHLMSYGMDIEGKPSLSRLIAFAAQRPQIGRVRLGSLEPAFIDDAFVDELSRLPANKLCPHFHLSLQSGSDTVLERMKRAYDTDNYTAAVKRLRSAFPGCAITTDIIAGFPGETSMEHRETVVFAREMDFARMHVFPFSRRKGTRAYDMPGQVRRVEKELRARELIALGKELEQKYLRSQIGSSQTVLVEECQDGTSEGYTANYVRARFQGVREGLIQVNVIGMQGNALLAIPKE